MRGRVFHDRAGDGVVRFSIVHHQRGEGTVIAGRRLIHPRDRLCGIVVEALGHGGAQRRPAGAPVERAQSVAHGREAERRAAAFVGNGKAVAADGEILAMNAQLGGAAGADDQDRPVFAAVRAKVGDLRVGGVGDRGEAEIQFTKRFAHAGARNAGNAHAGADLRPL